MEHAIHVAGGHFIRGVGPTSSRKVLKKVKAAHRNASGDASDEDLDSDVDLERAANSDDEDNQFDTGDTVGKALALVTQVGALEAFRCIGLMLYP
jgi:hypothetical protein